MSGTKEYMREWRKTERGQLTTKALSRAQVLAASWVRENHPEAWGQLLAQARAALGLPTEIGPGGNFTKPIPHGTKEGYRAHVYRKEKACDRCRVAWNIAQQEYRERRKRA